jgi:putative endonuclease
MYYTYVLYSQSFNKIYVGYSGDLKHRLQIHNDIRNSGWTAQFQPWEILYSEEHETKAAAMKREKQLKTSRGRVFIWEKVNDITL